jgi:hypothetical protein
MGLYLDIYIHGDLRPLVRGAGLIFNLTLILIVLPGTSRSAVTAGLIGGRVGNKGGVGISLDLNGKRSRVE